VDLIPEVADGAKTTRARNLGQLVRSQVFLSEHGAGEAYRRCRLDLGVPFRGRGTRDDRNCAHELLSPTFGDQNPVLE
jgi:hypothetical protein